MDEPKEHILIFGWKNREILDIRAWPWNLTDFCVSGRRYHSQNPYTIPEIVAALKAIARARGIAESEYLTINLHNLITN